MCDLESLYPADYRTKKELSLEEKTEIQQRNLKYLKKWINNMDYVSLLKNLKSKS